MPTFIRPARVRIDTSWEPVAVVAVVVVVAAVAAFISRYLAVITDALEIACLTGLTAAVAGGVFAVRHVMRDRAAIWHGQGSIWHPASVASLAGVAVPEVAAVPARQAITGQVIPAITARPASLGHLADIPAVILVGRDRGTR